MATPQGGYYTPTTARVRDLYSWAYAWRTADHVEEGESDLSGLRESQRAEFDRWLAEHDREVSAAAVRNLASLVATENPGLSKVTAENWARWIRAHADRASGDVAPGSAS